MREQRSEAEKVELRFNRAVLAAGAAAVIAIATGAYVVYRANKVVHGLEESVGNAASLYDDPMNAPLPKRPDP